MLLPGSPAAGVSAVMVGESIVNGKPLLWSVPAVICTFPLPAPSGAVATTVLSDQLEMTAACPLNVTVPIAAPNLVPAIVTGVPVVPLTGLRELIQGLFSCPTE